MPSVSVIMPIYNGAAYVEHAIRSILEQTLNDFELILINDGSTDETSEIINKFNDPRIAIIHHRWNQGIVSSLNDGLCQARGEFIARMDADDIISLPDRLSKQRAYLLRHPDYGACGSYFQVMGSEDTWYMPVHPEEVKCRLLFHCCLAHPTVMLRRHILEQYGLWYHSSYRHAEDYALWVRLSQVTKLSNVPEVLLYYRTHSNQVSFVHHTLQADQANRIRYEQLENLGVVPNREEWAHHLELVTGNGHLVPSDAKTVWFNKILKANIERNLYDQAVLTQLLAEF